MAFLYGLFYNHKLEAWRTGYDTAYFELAAGKIVLMRLLEEAFRRQYQEVDFLRGDEWYKNRLQVSERPYFWQIRLVSRWKPVPWFLIIAMPAIKEWVKGWMKRVKGNGKGAKEGQTQVKPDGTSQE